jgi:ribosomal protein L37AE/L43A
MLAENATPPCPACGGDMMGYSEPNEKRFIIWECRCCGASFVYDEQYSLQSYVTSFELMLATLRPESGEA